MDLECYLEEKRRAINEGLDRFLPPANEEPAIIHEAMRYSVFTGGKRLRPILVITAAEVSGGSESRALPTACAVEMIHTYSLIHDDLPCMDNDDFRRGKPTCHRVFGEMVAVLAGNALMSRAFQVIAEEYGDSETGGDFSLGLRLVDILAKASGSYGIIGGQVLDMLAEGKTVDITQLEKIHRRKTGALFTACLEVGGILGGANDAELEALVSYGRKAGLAFQIVDDLLDQEESLETEGDERKGKASYPLVVGRERSEAMARELIDGAKSALEIFGGRGEMLSSLADFILDRAY